jgi:hypothetical protein
MAVGKPDFNLNSFGIQYKEKRVKYFRKGDNDLSDDDFTSNQDNISTVSGKVKPQTPEDLATAKLNTSLNIPSVNAGTGASTGAGASAPRRAANAAQPAVKPTVKPKPAVKPTVKPKGDKDTKYVFNAEQDPKTMSISQTKLLEDVNEARSKNPKPDKITGITPEKRRDYPTQGVIANSANTTSGEEGGRTQDITERERSEDVGNKQETFDTSLAQTYHPKGTKAKKPTEEKKEKKTRGQDKKERETKDIPHKMGSRMVGNAPSEVKDTTNQVHSGKKVTVGVGEKAKEIFDKREGVGAVHEETSNAKEVVVKPDKELNSITSSENNRLGDHRKEMDKFLKGATDAQRREYTAIADREDGREDHDAQRAYARNITGKQSKTQEKVTQTKEEKAAERKQDHADRMTDMKERATKIQNDSDSEEPPVGVDNSNEFHGTEGKAGKVSRVTPTGKKPTKIGDNPDSSKAPPEVTEPDKITTDNIDDKLNTIASKLALIKDPKEREKKRAELSGKNESDKSKKEIEAAKKRVEAAKKKIQAAKTKKETAKKKKVIPKTGQLTPAQVKAYKKEREAKKDVVAKSNDIIMDTIIMKLNLMGNKKDDVFSPRSAEVGKRVGKRQGKKLGKKQVKTHMEETAPQITNTLAHNVLNNMKYRTDEDKKENNIEKTADETIFKAISLKLDLSKDL